MSGIFESGERKVKHKGGLMRGFKAMMKDKTASMFGEMGMNDLVELCLGLIILAALIPIALGMFYDAEVGSVFTDHPQMERLWNIVPIMVILSVVISIIYGALKVVPK